MAESSSAINRRRGSTQVTTGDESGCDKAVVYADGGKGKRNVGARGIWGRGRGYPSRQMVTKKRIRYVHAIRIEYVRG